MNDAGISVFLLSLPFGQEITFYETELVNSIFRKYQEAVSSKFANTAEREEFSRSYYKPHAYCTFGRFDIAVICLIDDFEFSCRTFHPFDPMMNTETRRPKIYFENFLHKVIACPTPLLEPEGGLIETAKRTFLSTEQRKPLFAVTLLKLNNSLLIGTGLSLLISVTKHAQALSGKFKKEDLEVIVLQSYSWHEITVLIFSKSYRFITDYINALKDTSLSDIADSQETGCEQNSLLAAFVKRFQITKKCSAAHVFADCDTVLGFDIDIFDGDSGRKRPDLLNHIDPHDRVELSTRWFVKPGHTSAVAEILEPDYHLGIAFGRGDIVARSKESSFNNRGLLLQDTRECIERFAMKDTQIAKHILQRYTTVSVEMTSSLPSISPDHPEFTNSLRVLGFTASDLFDLENSLRQLGTPKILSLKVLNMYSVFNDGLMDRNLYGFFLELLPFMCDFLSMVHHAAFTWRGDLSLWCQRIQSITESFELAYRNRFYNSHRLGEVSDFNIDFKGGIQQLVTALDGAYKAVASVVGNGHSFLAIAGYPGVDSTPAETRLNYFHVFQPEAFLTVAVHEAGWYCFNGRVSYASHALQQSLPRITKGTAETAGELRELFDSIRLSGVLPTSNPPVAADHEFLSAVVLDRMAFSLTYNNNPSLLWYWYLAAALQLPDAYERPLALSIPRNLGLLLRLCIVCGLDSEESVAPLMAPFANDDIGKVWADGGSAVIKAVKSLQESIQFLDWRTDAWRFVDDLRDSVWNEHSRVGERPMEAEEITQHVSTLADTFKDSLEKGEALRFEERGDFANFRFCQLLFLAYLTSMRQMLGTTSNTFLRRDPPEHKVQIGICGKALFDPFGGIFSCDAALRRDYFRVRSALIFSLWDLAFKTKLEPVWSRLLVHNEES